MSALDKVHRDSVDIKVAFSSGAKRFSAQKSQHAPEEPTLAHVQEPPTCPIIHSDQIHIEETPMLENANVPKKLSLGLAGGTKQLLRPVAKFVFRLLKPALRPVAFRIRNYLTAGMIQEIQRVHAATIQEMETARELLRRDVLNTHTLSLQEIQRVSAATIQEVQAARELLRQELQAIRESLSQELLQQTSYFQPIVGRIEQYTIASARRVAVSCANNEVLVRTEVGYVVCSSSDNSTIAHLIEHGEAERGIRLLIQKLLKPGDTFFDIGANLGLHTLAAAKVVGNSGQVIAFEPFEETAELLKKNVWMNGLLDRVEVQQKAVSKEAGFCKLFLGVGSAQHSLYPLSTPMGFERQSVEVPMVRLDDYVDEYPRIDLIKIDAEGAELDILSGAHDILTRNPELGIIVEYGPSHLQRSGHTTKKWIAEFEQLGMIYKVVNTETGSTFLPTIEEMEQFDIVNILFAFPNALLWRNVDAI